MLRGVISHEGRTDLVIFENGGINTQRYLEDVLVQKYVFLFSPFIRGRFIIMQDNAHPHRKIRYWV